MYTNYQNLKETVKLEADFWACGQCPCIKSEIITNLNIVYWVQILRVINIQYVKVFLPAWLKKRNIPSVLINCKTLSCLHRSWLTLNSGFNTEMLCMFSTVGGLMNMLCLVASAEGIKEWTCGGSFGEFGPQVALYMNETFISGYENIVFTILQLTRFTFGFSQSLKFEKAKMRRCSLWPLPQQ